MRHALWVLAVVALAVAPARVRGDEKKPAAAVEPSAEAVEKRARRKRAAELAGPHALLLVLAADDSPGFTGATQSLDFTYLSPFDARGAAVLVGLEQGPAGGDVAGQGPPSRAAAQGEVDRLYLRPRNPAAEAWSGSVAGPGGETAAAGAMGEALPVERLAADVAELLRDRRALLVSRGGPADGGRTLAAVLSSVRERLPDRLLHLAENPGAGRDEVMESLRRVLAEKPPEGKPVPAVDVRLATPILAELREVKSPAEIARIRAAVDATVRGVRDCLRAAKPGMPERHLQAILEFRCRLGGCARQAFPSIVGSGPNSCVLHYLRNDRTMEAGEVVVLDVGGEYEGYASDVTRTFPVSGRFTDEQAKVYDAVLDAQQAGIDKVRPGATLRQVHEAAAAVLEARGLIQYFIHFTSHSVGLDVHDLMRRDAPLRPGFVLTVEPGAYVAEKALGVRIEDTVLVTEKGCEVLSAAAPKTRREIEALMAQGPTLPLDGK